MAFTLAAIMAQFARLMFFIVACGSVAGCDGPTYHRFRDIRIAFEYQGHTYHETWVNDCIAHSDDPAWNTYLRAHTHRYIVARWTGYAKRLPDGSGVLFQFRQNTCGDGLIGQYLSGHPAQDDRFRGYDPSRQASMEEYAQAHPTEFYLPNVYWFDDVSHPSRIEVCIFPVCSQSTRSKVRVISMSADETTSKAASNPIEQIPYLQNAGEDRTRFVGYACWKIPVDGLPSWGVVVTPDQLLKSTEIHNGKATPGPVRANLVLGALRIIQYPLANAWTLQQNAIALAPVSDRDLSGDTDEHIHTAQSSWYRSCRRTGESVQLDDDREIGAPIVMKPLKAMDSPTMLQLPSGEVLDAGPKFPVGTPNYFHSDSDPTEYSAAAKKNRTLYVAEAHGLVPISPFRRGAPVFDVEGH